MSKFACTCGHTNRDNTNNIPYKALCYADEDTDIYFDDLETIVDLVLAREQEARERPSQSEQDERYRNHLKGQFFMLLRRYHIGHLHEAFECEQCGRLWFQVNPDGNTFVSYLPEGETRGVLRSHGGREDFPRFRVEKDALGEIRLRRHTLGDADVPQT